jgi:chromosome segregation ATPase
MQALLGGGIGPLSTGQKIAAVGQVLQAAGSRGASDPAAVLQNIRNQQMQQLNAQFQIAQLQQKKQEEDRLRASMEQFSKSLTENERNMFALLDETGRREFMLKRQQGREETDAEKKLRAAGIDPASPQGQKILQNVAASQGVISVTGPAGTTYVQAADIVLGGGAAAPAAQTIPQQAIDDLRSGVGSAEQFDRIFGKGKAAQYLGGGSGNTTGGFRGR